MAPQIKPVVSAPLAGCCIILSIFGVVILSVFGCELASSHRLKPTTLFQRLLALHRADFPSFFVCWLTGCFDHNVEAVMGATKDPEDGHTVAVTCYSAAAIYVAFILFCGCQVSIHRRYPRGSVQL
ncbi:hypothetical protein BDY24DRAFT_394063 [Mrakia frigida]|uniref:uncharacterized protein n=1 Tax=Mrakia frigida TaxID=29902 RepID=UPI003FCBF4D3